MEVAPEDAWGVCGDCEFPPVPTKNENTAPWEIYDRNPPRTMGRLEWLQQALLQESSRFATSVAAGGGNPITIHTSQLFTTRLRTVLRTSTRRPHMVEIGCCGERVGCGNESCVEKLRPLDPTHLVDVDRRWTAVVG